MATFYLKGLEIALDALLNEASAPSGTPKLSFMSTGYTPNAGTDQYYSDVSASVASGSPTVTLSNLDVRIDTGNARVEIDIDDISESGTTTTTDKFILWVDTGTPSTSPLVFSGDIDATLSPVGGILGLTIDAEGIAALRAAVS